MLNRLRPKALVQLVGLGFFAYYGTIRGEYAHACYYGIAVMMTAWGER